MGGQPLWRGTSTRADSCKSEVGSTDFDVRKIRFGILYRPLGPFTDGVVVGEIPQTEEDCVFGREYFIKWCAEGIY